jgi:hypothetical protein
VNPATVVSGRPWACQFCGRGLIANDGVHYCLESWAERQRTITTEAVRHLESLGYVVTPPGDARS